MEQHFRQSSYREKLIEHLSVGELLKVSWLHDNCALEVAKPEVDNRGCDVILERHGVVRHVQLKTSHVGATAAGQKIHKGLAEKPSGCVIWIRFNAESLALGPFLYFGGLPDARLPDISDFKVGKHTKANAKGVKGDRPDIRVVPKGRFTQFDTIEDLFGALFGSDAGTASSDFAICDGT